VEPGTERGSARRGPQAPLGQGLGAVHGTTLLLVERALLYRGSGVIAELMLPVVPVTVRTLDDELPGRLEQRPDERLLP
jgi:hypothetical protein